MRDLADGADRSATPQKMLEAQHRTAAMCRTRIPIVTAEVAALARLAHLPGPMRCFYVPDPRGGFRVRA